MKPSVYLFFFTFFINQAVFSQREIQYKVGVSSALLGSGDLSGFTLANEFQIPLIKVFSVHPQLFMSYGSKHVDNPAEPRFNSVIFGLSSPLVIRALNIKKFKLNLGLGPSVASVHSSMPNAYGTSVTDNVTQEIKYDFSYDQPSQILRLGYAAFTETEIMVLRKTSLAARLYFNDYTKGNSVVGIGLFLGHTF